MARIAEQLDGLPFNGDDLFAFLETLQHEGFPVGLREFILAQEILDFHNIHGTTDLTRLRNWLAPVVCTNADEQRLFYQRFQSWSQQFLATPDDDEVEPFEDIETELDRDVNRVVPWKWAAAAVGLIVIVCSVLLLNVDFAEPQEVIQDVPARPLECAQFRVPNVAGSPESEARLRLGDIGIKVNASRNINSDDVVAGMVIDTQPSAGACVDEGNGVELLVSLGPEQKPANQISVDGRVVDDSGNAIPGAILILAPGQPTQILSGHENVVRSASFSPDGSRIATASYEKNASVWLVDNGLLMQTLAHDGPVYTIQFSPDGTRIVTASNDNTARVWVTGSEAVFQTLAHSDDVINARFSPDGMRIVTASNDKTAKIWQIDSEIPLWTLQHDATVRNARFSNDGARVVTASNDDTARVWQSRSGRRLLTLNHRDLVINARFSPDDSRIVTVSNDKTVHIWQADSGRRLFTLQHDDLVIDARFSPDGSRIVSTAGNSAKVWSVDSGELLFTLQHEGLVRSAEYAPDGLRIVTASADRTARVWDAQRGGLNFILGGHEALVWLASYSPDATQIVTTSEDDQVRIWDTDTVESESDEAGGFSIESTANNAPVLFATHQGYHPASLQEAPSGPGALTVTAQLTPLAVEWSQVLDEHRTELFLFLFSLPLIITLIWWRWKRTRQRLILERRAERGIESVAVSIPEPVHQLFGDEHFVRARVEAHRRSRSGLGKLDVEATLEATVRHLGWFSPVFKSQLHQPSYLALIDRASFKDHQALLIDEFLYHLELGGVHVDRYYFDRDPRICASATQKEINQRPLKALATRYPEHRLLLFSDGGGLTNPVTGRLSGWTAQFDAWKERALMTPVPPFYWSARETELESRGFHVLPATVGGLLMFTEQLRSPHKSVSVSDQWFPEFPQIIANKSGRWLDEMEPSIDEARELLDQLRRYLGADGFRWLCALAVYPELEWNLTLYLGLELQRDNEAPVLNEQALLSLARLPWLRYGSLPDWLRLLLVAELSAQDENVVRSFLWRLLRSPLEAPDSEFKLDIARAPAGSKSSGWAAWYQALINTEPDHSPLVDHVFVGFLLGKRLNRLQVLAPRNWHRLVYERGLRSLGLRTDAGWILGIGAALLLSLAVNPIIDSVNARVAPENRSNIVLDQWQPLAPDGTKTDITLSSTVTDLIVHGETVYQANCVACHGPTGEGIPGAFPALTDSEIVTGDIGAHVDIVLNGREGTAMAAYSGQLNDEDIAAVIMYERAALGKDAWQRKALSTNLRDIVLPSTIAAVRTGLVDFPQVQQQMQEQVQQVQEQEPVQQVEEPAQQVQEQAQQVEEPALEQKQFAQGVITPPNTTTKLPSKSVSTAQSNADTNPAQLYVSACLACHTTGAAGAPRIGDAAAWSSRLDKGLDALVASAINGIGAMPPRGGSQYSDAQIRSVIEYMLDESITSQSSEEGAKDNAIQGDSAESQFITIGTGGVTGTFYPAGGAICRLINRDRKRHGIRCSAESTGGSVYNINTIRAGELDFGVAQSDWLYHAYNGTSRFASSGRFRSLRSVFSLHAEPMTVIASDESGIDRLTDIRGKRFNIGNPGSGTRSFWEMIEDALGWKRGDLELASELKPTEVGQAICDGKLDAGFLLTAHPSRLIQETLASCDTHLVDVTGPAIDRLVAEHSYLRYATIPAGMYNNKNDIKSFGVGATFVTSADESEYVVYTLVKEVFENIDSFRKLHPAFANLREAEMISDSLSAPLHRGALRYYRERGWM